MPKITTLPKDTNFAQNAYINYYYKTYYRQELS